MGTSIVLDVIRWFISGDGQLTWQETAEGDVVFPDFTVNVNRSEHISYPHGTKLVHKDIERSGLSNYNVSNVVPWLHEKQKFDEHGITSMKEIYDYLVELNLLILCFSLHDFFAFQRADVRVFDSLLKNYVEFPLMRSVIQDKDGILYVPVMHKSQPDNGIPVIRWTKLESFCSNRCPILCFL